ncbi:hypothetical protein SMICM304S_02143 [Streptomyces microflavus]
MRVLLVREHAGDVDHVDHPYGQLLQMTAEQVGGGQDLLGGDVPGAAEHHVRLAAAVLGPGPLPRPGPAGAVRMGSSRVSQSKVGCLPATITLT